MLMQITGGLIRCISKMDDQHVLRKIKNGCQTDVQADQRWMTNMSSGRSRMDNRQRMDD